jgi:hypothetical protein
MHSFWPTDDDRAVMEAFFEEYPRLALGMCYLLGSYRQAGMTTANAAKIVRTSIEALPLEEPS